VFTVGQTSFATIRIIIVMIARDGSLCRVHETITGLFEVLATAAVRAAVGAGTRPASRLLGVGAIVTAKRAADVTSTEVSVVGAPDEAGMHALFAAHGVEGPAVDCLQTGAPIRVTDLAIVRTRWPGFRAAAADAGIGATRTTPIGGTTMVGALTLFYTADSSFDDDEPMTDVLVGYGSRQVALAYEFVQSAARAGQLQAALNNRVLIEQAKGALAERHGIGVEAAFGRMRRYARPRQRRLHDVANAVLTGRLDLPGTTPAS
jgi:hypothetical protein